MWWLALVLAVVLSLSELFLVRRSPPGPSALHWAAARVGIDGAAGILAFAIGTAVWGSRVSPLVVAVSSGAGASVVLRTQVVVAGKGGKHHPIGLADSYHQIRQGLDNRISKADAKREATWINRRVLPSVGPMTPDEWDHWTRQYFLSMDHQLANNPTDSNRTRRKELAAVQSGVMLVITSARQAAGADPGWQRQVVNDLIANDCRDAVELLLQNCKTKP